MADRTRRGRGDGTVHQRAATMDTNTEGANRVESMNLRRILTEYQDHDGLGWPAMFAYLRAYDYRRIGDLTVSIGRDGFKEPILLGRDGVVLDGNHRLAIADALDWRMLPVEHEDVSDFMQRTSDAHIDV